MANDSAFRLIVDHVSIENGVHKLFWAFSGKSTNYLKDVDSAAVLAAGAKKEIAYLTKFGKPIHPFRRLYRELYNNQKHSPSDHLENLEKYLQVVPYLTPGNNGNLAHPTLKHTDLNPNNVFVSEKLDITRLIDWQHSAILPLFLQCGIPNTLQNYGDSVSEGLIPPELPSNFGDSSEKEQYEQVMLVQRRQFHYSYVAGTEKFNPIHTL